MIPRWLKQYPLYPHVRAGALAVLTHNPFYSPISAAFSYDPDREQAENKILQSLQEIRRENGLSIWQTPLGEIATPESDSAEHLAFILAEFQLNPYISEETPLRLGATVLDVGANIGLFARTAIAAGAGHVVCLEPSPNNIRALRWNLRASLCSGQASIVEKGAWDRSTMLSFTVDPKWSGRSSFVIRPGEPAAYEIQVQVETIDQIASDLGLSRIEFIKMDIEGAECCALKGAVRLLSKQKPKLAIAVEHTCDRLRNALDVRDLVLRLNEGYRCRPGRCYIEPSRRLVPDVLHFH